MDPVQTMNDAIVEFLNNIATSFASLAFEWLGDFIIATTDISRIPNIDLFITWGQYTGGALITFFLVKRVVEGLRDDMTGEGEPNYAEILASAALSMALVWAIPEIILMLIHINNLIVSGITSVGIDADLGGREVVEEFVGKDPTSASIHLIIMALIWVIC
ncbi:hypothetical protein, partial [Leifsonia shinshuensis]|uniref:hypothetical protein n=1 Tax=Leifsonia shinshuensis TaxID=150026 RepID=UPI0035E63BFB